MADLRVHSATSNLIRFTLKHATTGVGLTGLSSASSGLIISTIADNEATATAYTVAGSTIESITTLGTFAAPTATKCRFKEVDATNHKGLYEFQFADARFSVASAKRLIISATGATNLLDADYEIQLVAFDMYTAIAQTGDAYARLGAPAGASVSADVAASKADTAAIKTKTDFLPSVTAGAAGGVFIAGTNAATTVTAGFTTTFTGNITGSVNSVATDVGITQAAADKVWGTAARILTAGTNISLAKGTGITGFNDLDAAGVAAATWNAATATYGSAGSYGLLVETNLDAAVSSRSTYAGGAVASVTGAVGSVTGLTASDVAAIKAKTDSLTFTVAGQVDANVQAVNDIQIIGNGTTVPMSA